MPPNLTLLSTLIGSNFPCLELIFMVPKVFEPLKFHYINKSERTVGHDQKHTIGPNKIKLTDLSNICVNENVSKISLRLRFSNWLMILQLCIYILNLPF